MSFSTDWTKNQKVTVGFGGRCCHVSGQHLHDQIKVPEELGESTREIRWFVPARYAVTKNTEEHVIQRLGQSRRGRDDKHTSGVWHRRTKSGMTQRFIVDLKPERFDVYEQRESLYFLRKCDLLSVNYSDNCLCSAFSSRNIAEEDRMRPHSRHCLYNTINRFSGAAH